MMIDVALRLGETSGQPIRATGTIGSAARVALKAFDHPKHWVSVNAEAGLLLGPVLKAKWTILGLRLVAAGNIKGIGASIALQFCKGPLGRGRLRT